VSTSQDDLPTRLVRVAALQLGDRELAARWGEEWLFSLPPRDRYRRWRYALSLLVRGAHAIRWEIRRPGIGSNWYSFPAALRRGFCLLLTGVTVLACINAHNIGWVWLWGPWAAADWSVVGSCCAATLALLVLSVHHRTARWVLAAGIAFSLVESWTGTWFLQVSAPAGIDVNILPTAWNITLQAVFLAAVLGGLVIIAAYRTPALTRVCTTLAVSILISEIGVFCTPLGIFGDLTMPYGSLTDRSYPGIEIFWNEACSFLASLVHPGPWTDLQQGLYYILWDLQFPILAGVAAIAVRAGSSGVRALRVSARQRAADRAVAR
jgi:hypothetical protein